MEALPDDFENMDLSEQLDSLIDNLKKDEPELVEQAMARAEQIKKGEIPEDQPALSDDGQQVGAPASEPALSEDDLADQLADILGDQAEESPTEEPAEAAEQASAEPAPAVLPTKDAAEDELADQLEDILGQAGDQDPAPPEPVEDEASAVQAIDELLADQADDAITGDFETVNDVLASESSPTAPAQPQQALGDDDALQIPQEAAPSTEGAQSVANELDSQPEQQAQADDPVPADDAVPQGKVVIRTQNLRVVCKIINKPVAMLPPMGREAVGMLSIATMVMGFTLLGYGLIKQLF